MDWSEWGFEDLHWPGGKDTLSHCDCGEGASRLASWLIRSPSSLLGRQAKGRCWRRRSVRRLCRTPPLTSRAWGRSRGAPRRCLQIIMHLTKFNWKDITANVSMQDEALLISLGAHLMMMKMTAMVMIDYHHWVRRIFDQNTKNNVLTLKVASIPILEIVWRPSSALLVSHWTTHGLEKDIENMCSATSAKGYLMNAFQTFQTRWCVRSALLEIGIVLGQWSLLSHRVWTLK